MTTKDERLIHRSNNRYGDKLMTFCNIIATSCFHVRRFASRHKCLGFEPNTWLFMWSLHVLRVYFFMRFRKMPRRASSDMKRHACKLLKSLNIKDASHIEEQPCFLQWQSCSTPTPHTYFWLANATQNGGGLRQLVFCFAISTTLKPERLLCTLKI